MWKNDDHRLTLVGHYIGGYDNDDDIDPDTMKPSEVDAWITFDLTYQYTLLDVVGKETLLSLGVLNLTDEDPPRVQGTSYDLFTHDPRGRLLYAKLTQTF
jgi:outer membrane receptor protein involved in Fe transport